MDTDARLDWEAPAAIPLTDSEGRADQADVWLQNAATVISGAG